MSINNVNSNSLNSIMERSDFNSAGSVQLMFAKLQLSLSEQAKTNATDKMNEIQKAQDEQKQIAALLQEARQLQADAKSSGKDTAMPASMQAYATAEGLAFTDNGAALRTNLEKALTECENLQADALAGRGNCPWDRHASMMPQSTANLLSENGIRYDIYGHDLANNPREWNVAIISLKSFLSEEIPNKQSAEDWDVMIASLQAKQEEVGTNTQQLMVYVQDFMGQYNSYLQGANSSIQESNQTLGSIARGG